MTFSHFTTVALGFFAAAVAPFSLAEEKEEKKVPYPKGEGHEWLVFPGGEGPGQGKHIALLSGDDEYRSEEALPALAKILSTHHGFKCTVTFSLNPNNGNVDPTNHVNLPGLAAALNSADACILFWRFREPKDEDMKVFDAYFKAGKPFIALRTSTHAFSFDSNKNSPYAKRYDWHGSEWEGGFGKQVLGETWVDHWGGHGKQATRGIIEDSAKNHPLFKGVASMFGDTDVYEAYPPADATILARGQVLEGMNPDSPPATGPRKKQQINDPMMPVVWTREYKHEDGKTTNKILTTTMGSSTDLLDEGFRRFLVNATYWATGLEDKIPDAAKVDFVGEYKPTRYGFGTFQKDKKPADLAK